MIQKLQNAHPAVNLKVAYERLVRAGRRIKGEVVFNRETLVKAMGFEGKKSGTAHNVAGSLVHFGLLRKVEGGYVISRQTRELLDLSSNSDVWRTRMKDVALNPEMYKYLYRKYEVDLPPNIRDQLIGKYGDRNVNDRSVESIVNSYLESLKFAGYEIANDKNRTLHTQPPLSQQKQAIELDGQTVYVFNKYLLEAYHKTLQDDLRLVRAKLQDFSENE